MGTDALSNKDFVENLYIDNKDALYDYVKKRVHSDFVALDIIQETFVQALRSAETLRFHPNIPGWLFNTAKFKMLEEQKKMKYAEVLYDHIETLEFHDKCFEVVEIECCLDKLKPMDAGILRCVYLDGDALDEVARKSGISYVAAKQRLSRARKRFCKFLKSS